MICSVLFLNESLGHTAARHLGVNVSVACKRLLLALFHQPEKLQSSPLSTRYCSTTHTHTHTPVNTRTPLPSFCVLSPPLSLSHREIPPLQIHTHPLPLSPFLLPHPSHSILFLSSLIGDAAHTALYTSLFLFFSCLRLLHCGVISTGQYETLPLSSPSNSVTSKYPIVFAEMQHV